MGWSLFAHSLSLWSIFVPALLVSRTNFGQKGLWVGWYPYSSTGSPAGLQEVATSDFMPPAASHSSSHPHRLPGASPIPGLWHILEIPSHTLISIHSPGPLSLLLILHILFISIFPPPTSSFPGIPTYVPLRSVYPFERICREGLLQPCEGWMTQAGIVLPLLRQV